ncbi:MAG TPA: hypothetical protein VIM36_02105 [Gemmatimonadaceae bacterium]|jgi:hypothetical protein
MWKRIVATLVEALRRPVAQNFHASANATQEAVKMRQSWRKTRSILLAGLPVLLLACGSSTAPAANSVAGSYIPIIWVTTGGTGQTSELQVGSTLSLTLHANGLTSGHLHLAATASRPVFDADMSGSWTQNGSTLSISQSIDTFVQHTSFEMSPDPVSGWDLAGTTNFGGAQVQIILIPG